MRALVLLAAGCMVASAYGFRPQLESLVHYRPTPGPEDYYAGYAPWAFAAGALLLIAALALSRAPEMSARWAAPRLTALHPRWAWALTAPGLLALAAVTEANAALAGIESLRTLSHHAQFVLLAGGNRARGVGLGGSEAACPARKPRPRSRAATGADRAALGLRLCEPPATWCA